MEVIREFVIFFLTVLNGRAYQTRFKSEQSIFAALGMLLYFIYFCAYYTHKRHTQMDASYANERVAKLANKRFNLGLFNFCCRSSTNIFKNKREKVNNESLTQIYYRCCISMAA